MDNSIGVVLGEEKKDNVKNHIEEYLERNSVSFGTDENSDSNEFDGTDCNKISGCDEVSSLSMTENAQTFKHSITTNIKGIHLRSHSSRNLNIM